MIDQNGRLFGKFNIIDMSFAVIVLAMLVGLVWVLSGQGPLEKQILARGQAEVTVAVRGGRVQDPGIFKEGEDVFLTIRNQRFEKVRVVKVEHFKRQMALMGPDGKPVTVNDPASPDVVDVNITFTHTAEQTPEGIKTGGHHLKVGNTVELDGYDYRFRGSIMSVQFKAD